MEGVQLLLSKLLAVAGLFILLAVTVYASPFLACDPQEGVTYYQLTGWTQATEPAQADGSIKLDVATAQVGTTPLTVKACKTDAVWGVLCSEAVPFDLTRPSPLAIPTGISLTP